MISWIKRFWMRHLHVHQWQDWSVSSIANPFGSHWQVCKTCRQTRCVDPGHIRPIRLLHTVDAGFIRGRRK